jgi:DNA-binding NtrC family response regulator
MNTQRLEQIFESRMILIDDDPTYCSIMRKIAAKKNISLDIFPSIMDVAEAGSEVHGAYLAAIIDFDLGQVNGLEITGYLGSLLGDVPMILVSGTDRTEEAKRASGKIKAFINKSDGYDFILEKAEAASHGILLAS